jgi:spermidine synthase
MARRRRKQHARPGDRARTALPTRHAGDSLAAIIACFFLSGFAALLYQTAWLRQLSLVFGTSELAVVAVLAAYMAGLAIGAAISVRYVGAVERPILVYGLLEAGIALSALTVPILLSRAGALYGWALGNLPEPPEAASLAQPLFQLGVAFLVLAIPTGLMGATLPLLTRQAVRRDRDVAPRVALLYAANTAGAVLGTVVTGFLLLPTVGLAKTVWFGVAVNALVFAIAAAFARRAPAVSIDAAAGERGGARPRPPGFLASCVTPLFSRATPRSERMRRVFDAQPAWILLVMLVSGAVAFLYEVVWTRLLAHVLGGSIFAFSTMLAAFLTGIALGGGLAGRLGGGRPRAATAFAATQLAIGVLSMAVYAWMGARVPGDRQTASLVAYAIAVMVPATFFIGATFPLAVRILARDEREASVVTARVYAWNTVGAIAGAILAGFWLVPGLGFEGSIRLAVCVNLGLALVTLAFVARPRRLPLAALALALLGAVLFYHPARPLALVSRTGFAVDFQETPRQIFYAVGRSATVVLMETSGRFTLLTNGLPEAAIARRGSPPDQDAQKWLTTLAVVARPDVENMLVVGYGGGVALEAIPPSVRQIDVVEIEPEVIEANRTLAGLRDRDPLTDVRIRVIINDARNALRLTTRRYDAIVSQPSHPWTAGASHLFTREFVRSAKAHLNPGGVFVQWMNSEFVTEPLLRSLTATLLAEFPHLRLYRPYSTALFFLASETPLEVELEMARTQRPLRDDPAHYARLGIASVEDLLAALAVDGAGLEKFARGAPIATDDQNRMATQSRSRADGLTSPQIDALLEPFDPLSDPGGWIHTKLAGSLNLAYLANRILGLGRASRAGLLARGTSDESTRLLIDAQRHRMEGAVEKARAANQAAVAADPGNQQARYALARDQLALLAGAQRADSREALLTGLTEPARAVMRGLGYSIARDWRALAALDLEMARSLPTDLWYPDAVLLRAQHRIALDRESGPRMREALDLIDRALVASQDTNLFVQRALAGVALGDRDVFVESARRVVTSSLARLDQAGKPGDALHPADRDAIRQTLAGLIRELGKEGRGGSPAREAVVRAAAEQALQRLDAIAAPGNSPSS